jgi:hypothetical protein
LPCIVCLLQTLHQLNKPVLLQCRQWAFHLIAIFWKIILTSKIYSQNRVLLTINNLYNHLPCHICSGQTSEPEFCDSTIAMCAMSQVCKIFAGEQQLMESAIKAY